MAAVTGVGDRTREAVVRRDDEDAVELIDGLSQVAQVFIGLGERPLVARGFDPGIVMPCLVGHLQVQQEKIDARLVPEQNRLARAYRVFAVCGGWVIAEGFADFIFLDVMAPTVGRLAVFALPENFAVLREPRLNPGMAGKDRGI